MNMFFECSKKEWMKIKIILCSLFLISFFYIIILISSISLGPLAIFNLQSSNIENQYYFYIFTIIDYSIIILSLVINILLLIISDSYKYLIFYSTNLLVNLITLIFQTIYIIKLNILFDVQYDMLFISYMIMLIILKSMNILLSLVIVYNIKKKYLDKKEYINSNLSF